MKQSTIERPKVVTRDQWLAAHKEHLRVEKKFTRLRDELSRQRRELPRVKVEDRKRMGWRFNWVSSHANDFNFDYHVSFMKEGMAKGKVYYNYDMEGFGSEEAPGVSVFHTYSAYARGLDMLVGAYNYLDLTPKGRDEAKLPWTMAWVRHHDKYGD